MSLRSVPRPVVAWLSRDLVCEVPTRSRLVALTFDDGPDPRATPRVLEILAERGHTATFFCIGRHARRHPAIVAEAAAAGHEVANHTWTHVPLPLVSHRRVVEEVRRTDWVLASIAGTLPRHFRPPLGWATRAILRTVAEQGYRSVLGTIYPGDPRAGDAEAIVTRTVPRLAPGRIVILHDGSSGPSAREHTLAALPEILGQLEARGLRGVSVRELLRASGPAEEPPRRGLDAPPPAVSEGHARGRLPAGARGSRS